MEGAKLKQRLTHTHTHTQWKKVRSKMGTPWKIKLFGAWRPETIFIFPLSPYDGFSRSSNDSHDATLLLIECFVKRPRKPTSTPSNSVKYFLCHVVGRFMIPLCGNFRFFLLSRAFVVCGISCGDCLVGSTGVRVDIEARTWPASNPAKPRQSATRTRRSITMAAATGPQGRQQFPLRLRFPSQGRKRRREKY